MVRASINGTFYDFNIGPVVPDIWYGLVFNMSNEFSQIGVNVWKMKEGTSELIKVFAEAKPFYPATFDTGVNWHIDAHAISITNIRMFDAMVEEERQSNVLNQLIVRDADKAIIIDNCKNPIRLNKITNPK